MQDATDPLSPEDVARVDPDPQAAFRDNLADGETRIAAACVRAGRARAEVRLQLGDESFGVEAQSMML